MNCPPPPLPLPPPPMLPLVRQLTNTKFDCGRREAAWGGYPVCVSIVRESPDSPMATVYCLVSWVVEGEGITEVTSRINLLDFQPSDGDFPSLRCIAEAVQEDVLLAPFARRLEHLSPPCLRKRHTIHR